MDLILYFFRGCISYFLVLHVANRSDVSQLEYRLVNGENIIMLASDTWNIHLKLTVFKKYEKEPSVQKTIISLR